MLRALPMVAVLAMPMMQLHAQSGYSGEESDSTESTLVRGVATIGGIGFSLLRLAVQRNDGGPAAQFCYGTCAMSRRSAAALAPTHGPTVQSQRAMHAQSEDASNDRANAAAGNARRPDDKLTDAHLEVSDDIFDYDEIGYKGKGIGPIMSNENSRFHRNPDLPWLNSGEPACAMHACIPDKPLVNPLPTGPNNDVTWSGWNGDPAPQGGYTFDGGGPPNVLVNPEPGTWALLGAGLGGLAIAGRRRRRS